ncbi:MAG: hypothetical protein WCI46_02420 [Verrucomicrobiota bacterium]
MSTNQNALPLGVDETHSMVVALENWRHRRSWVPLRQGEVHLWRARLESLPSLACHLSVEEWMRAGQFVSDLDRTRYLASRGLLRSIIARYTLTSPSSLKFTRNSLGKIALTDLATSLQFSLSYSADLLLLAVTYVRGIGVQLENVEPNLPFEVLADHYFEPEEAWELRNLSPSGRAWKFYDTWTTTEAQIIAKENLPDGSFPEKNADRWSILKFTPAPGYAAALALEGTDFRLKCWSWT